MDCPHRTDCLILSGEYLRPVHFAEIPGNEKDARNLLGEGFDLMGQAIRRAVTEGLPNWNEIVLG